MSQPPALRRRRSPVTREAAEKIASKYAIASSAGFRKSLNEAAQDYLAHAAHEQKGLVAALERKQATLLRTLARRVRGHRRDRLRETLQRLGFRGAVELGIYGWNGDPADESLARATAEALAKRDSDLGRRLRSGSGLWLNALTCMWARARSEIGPIGKDADGLATGTLAEFISDCSHVAGVPVNRIPESTLRLIASSPFVKRSLAKGNTSAAK